MSSDKPSAIERLQDTECLASLAPAALEHLAERMESRPFSEGDTLAERGQVAEEMLLIDAGQAEVLAPDEDGNQQQVAQAAPGDVVGELALLSGGEHAVSVRASTDGAAWHLPAQAITDLLAGDCSAAEALMNSLGRRLRRQRRAAEEWRSAAGGKRPRIALFDTKPYTERAFQETNDGQFELKFFQPRLTQDTASLAEGFTAVCAFVNDDLSEPVIAELARRDVRLIAMRCAGYNNVDLDAAAKHGLDVARVPAYSPNAVAEHAVGLMLSLNRHIHRAHDRVRQGNFSLEGLVGFDMKGKTVGVLGTGKIGQTISEILLGFGCRVLAYDKYPDEQFGRREGVSYVDLDDLLGKSDIITLHVPLVEGTYHIIDAEAIDKMKPGVMLINTGRGALIDTAALIDGLKSQQIGSAGLDVYEEENEYFFEDRSLEVITDDLLARLMTFNNVLITSHQGFLTREALGNIAQTTLDNVAEFQAGKRGEDLTNGVCPRCG